MNRHKTLDTRHVQAVVIDTRHGQVLDTRNLTWTETKHELALAVRQNSWTGTRH